jgi:hypothetical protein
MTATQHSTQPLDILAAPLDPGRLLITVNGDLDELGVDQLVRRISDVLEQTVPPRSNSTWPGSISSTPQPPTVCVGCTAWPPAPAACYRSAPRHSSPGGCSPPWAWHRSFHSGPVPHGVGTRQLTITKTTIVIERGGVTPPRRPRLGR